MNVVMMCRWLGLVVAMGMVVVVVVSASTSESTLLVHPSSHQSAIHASVEGKGSLIREAKLDLQKPAPKPGYPPPPGNPSLQQDPTVSSTIISDSFMGMVLKRSEEVMEALLVNRFHLRGLDNLLSFKSLQPKTKPIARPSPKPRYPPPPPNIGLQQDPTVLSTIISDSRMGMVLKRSEEVMEALLVNRFHLRGLDNLLSFKSLQPKTKPNARPSPKPRYPPPPKSPLATNKARPAPQGYPPSPTTPRADVYQEQHNPAKINGLETM